MAHVLLKDDELPAKGTLVAIDAEFVSLQQVSVAFKRGLRRGAAL